MCFLEDGLKSVVFIHLKNVQITEPSNISKFMNGTTVEIIRLEQSRIFKIEEIWSGRIHLGIGNIKERNIQSNPFGIKKLINSKYTKDLTTN